MIASEGCQLDGKMVSVAHSPHVNGKAGRKDVVTHRTGKETGKEQRSKQNGGLPHLVIVRAHRPKQTVHNHANATTLSVSLPAPQPPPAEDRQTHGQPTPLTSTAVGGKRGSEGGHSLCPQAALSYTTAIISKRAERILSRQKSLDHRLQLLHRRVRGRQGKGMCRHVQSQIRSAIVREEVAHDPLPMQVDGAIEDVDMSHVACRLQRSCDNFDQSKCDDGDVLNCVVTESHEPKLEADVPPALLAGDQLPEAEESSEQQCDGRSEVVERWRQQLHTVCEGGGEGGGDVTDRSSDEEGEGPPYAADIRRKRLHQVCRKWERSRGPIGSQWAWLRHRITHINKELSQLDQIIQQRPKQEPFLHSSPSPSLSQTPSLWGVGVDKGKVVNGSNHTPSVPHILIPDGIINGPIQVKDLLSPSPLTNNMAFILDDAVGYTCARTRPLNKKPARKIVHLSQNEGCGVRRMQRPFLSHDVPSWVWLDEAVQHVLRDHPNGVMPQPKRCHRARSRNRTATISPCPVDYEVGTDSSVKINVQRRLNMDESPILSRSSTPVPLPLFTPGTPSLPYPLTPSFARKKRPPSHTPSYDIDNIVIPYSMAATTRLEKLEYKEIVTPRWREVVTMSTDPAPSSTHSDVEDTSDDGFRRRHQRFEGIEKKRFMYFISGGQRKRTRPSSLSSTPDPLQNLSWPPAKLRRSTFPASPADSPVPPSVPVLSWPPRSFPLQGSDIEALTCPPPPPPLPLPTPRTSSSSPSPLLSHPLTPSLPPTPSTSSVMVTPHGTPLSSPCSPFGEKPVSPSEWAVNSQIAPIKPTCVTAPGGNLVLKLTKKT